MDKINEALKHYGFEAADVEFIRHNENMTYKINHMNQTYVLRIHQPIEGFSLDLIHGKIRKDRFIKAEMDLLEHLSEQKTQVQTPLRNLHGQSVSYLEDGSPVTVLRWIDGEILDSVDERRAFKLGQTMADFHKQVIESDLISKNLNRHSYDVHLLCDMVQEFEEAARLGHLTDDQCDQLIQVCLNISDCMVKLDLEDEGFGYIHSDFSKDNLIDTGEHTVPIDFSLSGYGYYFMDLGMFLCKFKDSQVKRELVRGYESIRQIQVPQRHLESFYNMGILLFIACQHTRAHEEGWLDEKMKDWGERVFAPYLDHETFIY